MLPLCCKDGFMVGLSLFSGVGDILFNSGSNDILEN